MIAPAIMELVEPISGFSHGFWRRAVFVPVQSYPETVERRDWHLGPPGCEQP